MTSLYISLFQQDSFKFFGTHTSGHVPKDSKPLETVAPELSKQDKECLGDADADGDQMADVYQSQLTKQKEIKVASAQHLVDKASRTQKSSNKPSSLRVGVGEEEEEGEGGGRLLNLPILKLVNNLNQKPQSHCESGASRSLLMAALRPRLVNSLQIPRKLRKCLQLLRRNLHLLRRCLQRPRMGLGLHLRSLQRLPRRWLKIWTSYGPRRNPSYKEYSNKSSVSYLLYIHVTGAHHFYTQLQTWQTWYDFVVIWSQTLKEFWWTKEKDVRALGVEIPGDVAEKKSFTVKSPGHCVGCGTIGILFLELTLSLKYILVTFGQISSLPHHDPKQYLGHAHKRVGLFMIFPFAPVDKLHSEFHLHLQSWPRWTIDQIYVSKVINADPDVKVNKKLGATISVRRRGGWKASYDLAKNLAGWNVKAS